MRPASLDDGELWDDGASGDLGGGSFGAPEGGSARCSGLPGTPEKEQHQPRGRAAARRMVWCVESSMGVVWCGVVWGLGRRGAGGRGGVGTGGGSSAPIWW
jgi:hypothetical protein